MATYLPTEKEVKSAPKSRILAKRAEKPFVNAYAGGILLGIVLFLSFFITGNGLGASGGMNRLIVFFEGSCLTM